VQVFPLAYVGANAVLGDGVLVNTAAVVEHDASLAAGAVVLPNATVSGRVRIGRDAMIGAGATVLPDVSVGPEAVGVDQASNLTVSLQVGFGFGSADMQSTPRMKAGGAIATAFFAGSESGSPCEKGDMPPATTTLSRWTPCTASAAAFTRSR
jgi:hypothetical protein